ncbi:MAG: hexitol phosphatase HxpB [Bacteroidales bacterium]|nr:hexitol phosphatase HxpB [Bacteroidales bacterium]
MLKAVVFDMDGVLLDSEPIWQEEERKVFGNLGIELNPSMQEATYGLAPKEMIEHWYNYKPWKDKTHEEVKEELLERVIARVMNGIEPLKGVKNTLKFFKQANLKIGLASSSPMDMIIAVITSLGIAEYFDALCTAEDEDHAKPHPAVYMSAVKMLHVHPSDSLAIEDSFLGVLAAKAARMKVLAVPDKMHFDDPKYVIADLKLPSLQEFNKDHFEYLNHLN